MRTVLKTLTQYLLDGTLTLGKIKLENWKQFQIEYKKNSQAAKFVWYHESLGVWMVEQTIWL